MKHLLARTKVALLHANDAEWTILIAVTALVFVFLFLVTGNVSMKF